MPTFSIHDEGQMEVYASLFKLLKNWTSNVIIHCTSEGLRIQTMDKSHVCLAEIRFDATWFHHFECVSPTDICVSTFKMDTILAHSLHHGCIQFVYDEDSPDVLHIHLAQDQDQDQDEQIPEEESKQEPLVEDPVPVEAQDQPKKKAKKETKKEKAAREAAELVAAATATATAVEAKSEAKSEDKGKSKDKGKGKDKSKKGKGLTSGYVYHYELTLDNVDEVDLEIPEVEYDVEFGIDAKKLTEVLSQLALFGESVKFTCTEEHILLQSIGNDNEGKLNVCINIDDLEEYSLSEGVTTDVMFSLGILSRLCISSKLSSQINIQLSNNYPMAIRYGMSHNSCALFFIAPKIED